MEIEIDGRIYWIAKILDGDKLQLMPDPEEGLRPHVIKTRSNFWPIFWCIVLIVVLIKLIL